MYQRDIEQSRDGAGRRCCSQLPPTSLNPRRAWPSQGQCRELRDWQDFLEIKGWLDEAMLRHRRRSRSGNNRDLTCSQRHKIKLQTVELLVFVSLITTTLPGKLNTHHWGRKQPNSVQSSTSSQFLAKGLPESALDMEEKSASCRTNGANKLLISTC